MISLSWQVHNNYVLTSFIPYLISGLEASYIEVKKITKAWLELIIRSSPDVVNRTEGDPNLRGVMSNVQESYEQRECTAQL